MPPGTTLSNNASSAAISAGASLRSMCRYAIASGDCPSKTSGIRTLEDLDLRIRLKLLSHPAFQLRTMFGHPVMQHSFLVLEQIVDPEILREVVTTQIVDDRLDAHAGIGAALDEIAVELHAMIGGARQYVTSPYDRRVGVVLHIGSPTN